ncbi:MAG: DUF721 domain-containing protein [Actinobacteria bacterium]|nr:DUF721 domain-containing protein [Actinomycetota bacterium]MBI3687374.1 DUF721 domain-containing protein [Actinomycetota bacterium]
MSGEPPPASGPPPGSGRPSPTGDLGRAAFDAARQAARRRGAGSTSAGSRRRPTSDAAQKGGYSAAGPDERDPRHVRDLVRGLITDRGWNSTVTAASVVSRWEALVGTEIASRCRPESLEDGELVLAAESTAWATQLRMLAPKLVGRIAAELGAGVVTRIRVHGPVTPTWRKGPLRIVGRGPRDTYG